MCYCSWINLCVYSIENFIEIVHVNNIKYVFCSSSRNDYLMSLNKSEIEIMHGTLQISYEIDLKMWFIARTCYGTNCRCVSKVERHQRVSDMCK